MARFLSVGPKVALKSNPSKSGNRIEQVTTDLRSSGGTLVVVSRVKAAFPNSLDAFSDDLFFLEEVPFNSIASGGGVEKYLELLSLFHGVPWGLARVAAESQKNSRCPGELLIDVVPVPVLGITRVADTALEITCFSRKAKFYVFEWIIWNSSICVQYFTELFTKEHSV